LIVYVESNFVLEIALGQEQSVAAEGILAQAESGAVQLAFPALATTEPLSTVDHSARERRRLSHALNDQVRQLARSRPHQHDLNFLRSIDTVLATIEQRELGLVLATVDRLLRAGRPVALDARLFARALALRARFQLSAPDAIVLAAVLDDASARDADERKCFATRNWGDFGQVDIRADLRAVNCTYIANYGRALQFLTGLR
jgi:hypothetical protein